MTKTFSRFLAATTLGGIMLIAPAIAMANKGDCGQPNSTGANPSSSDALIILQFGVGIDNACSDNPCICDVNASGSTTAGDAPQQAPEKTNRNCASQNNRHTEGEG